MFSVGENMKSFDQFVNCILCYIFGHSFDRESIQKLGADGYEVDIGHCAICGKIMAAPEGNDA